MPFSTTSDFQTYGDDPSVTDPTTGDGITGGIGGGQSDNQDYTGPTLPGMDFYGTPGPDPVGATPSDFIDVTGNRHSTPVPGGTDGTVDPGVYQNLGNTISGITTGNGFGGADLTGTPAATSGDIFSRRLDGAVTPVDYTRRLDQNGTMPPSPATPAGPLLPGQSPSTGPGPTGGNGSPGQLSPDQWNADWQKAEGFAADPHFNDKADFLANAQRGDMVIRGYDSTGRQVGPDQLAAMANYDSDARRVLNDINARPDFYQSANTDKWIGQHDTQIANRIAAGEFGTGAAQGQAGNTLGQMNAGRGGAGQFGGAGLADILSQRIPNNPNPIDNQHALMTDQMQKAVVDALSQLGASNFQPVFNDYGGMTIGYTSASGKQMKLETPDGKPFALADYANALQQLRDAAAQATATATAPATTGGGGGGIPARGPSTASRGPSTPSRGFSPPPPPQQTPAATPGGYAYQGQAASYNPSSETFNSVVNGQPITSPPIAVAPGTSNVIRPIQPY